jgi:transposase
MKVHILGIDLAKNVFQLHGVDRKERPVLVRRVRREQLLKILGELEPCLIGIEASTGAFYWQRQFEKLARSRREDHGPAIREAVRPPTKERQQ